MSREVSGKAPGTRIVHTKCRRLRRIWKKPRWKEIVLAADQGSTKI